METWPHGFFVAAGVADMIGFPGLGAGVAVLPGRAVGPRTTEGVGPGAVALRTDSCFK